MLEKVASMEEPAEMHINSTVNIRGKHHSAPGDIPEGQENRGLPNFNHLIDKVTVRDTYVSKL